jgi:hypothetical protein
MNGMKSQNQLFLGKSLRFILLILFIPVIYAFLMFF